jgi:hypothetical protein
MRHDDLPFVTEHDVAGVGKLSECGIRLRPVETCLRGCLLAVEGTPSTRERAVDGQSNGFCSAAQVSHKKIVRPSRLRWPKVFGELATAL